MATRGCHTETQFFEWSIEEVRRQKCLQKDGSFRCFVMFSLHVMTMFKAEIVCFGIIGLKH